MGGGGGKYVAEKYSRKGKLSEKNHARQKNPKLYNLKLFMQRPYKNSYKENVLEKNFMQFENSPPSQ